LAAVPTAVISDLHLGAASGRDILRLPEPRARLLEALAAADRVIVLGDLLELREQPVARVLETAAPALTGLAQACDGKPLIVVPGNHDHHLADAFLDQLRLEDQDLGLEQRARADGHPGLLGRLAELLPGADLSLSYPGLWLREDVFATHGHQVDVHMTVPRPEAIMCSAMRRVTLRRAPRSPSDYEAIVDPLYSLFHGIAQASSQRTMERTSGASRSIWQLLQGGGLGGFAVGRVALPAGVLALNAAGFGPFRPEVTGAELRDSGLRAMGEAARNMGIEAAHVMFGHTHRPWPIEGRDHDWRTPGGALLHNTGSWYHEGSLIGDAGQGSPYWPGWISWLDDSGPPRLQNVLEGVEL
jgi:UDP-2,3-diacylglucosamine pyrophosphatase LpxH